MKKHNKLLLFLIILALLNNTAIGQNNIVGIPIKIDNVEVAQFDFPRRMTWNDAMKACAELGMGWRLPTIEEFTILYNNKSKIGNFRDPYLAYWSSSEMKKENAWYIVIKDGFTRSTEKYYESGVRAVRSLNNSTNISRNVPNSQDNSKIYYTTLYDNAGNKSYEGYVLEKTEESNRGGTIYRNTTVYLHGKGTSYFKDGGSLTGERTYNELNGPVELSSNGFHYVGEYQNSKKNGKGKEWYDGSESLKYSYEGDYVNNKRHGYGVFQGDTWKYEGYFEAGEYSGQGKLTSKDDGKITTYIGNWSNGKYNGYGEITYGNGETYKGNWMNGYKHGMGEYYSAGGKIIQKGQFENNIYQEAPIKSDNNSLGDNQSKTGINKFPNSNFGELTVGNITIREKVSKQLEDLYIKVAAYSMYGSALGVKDNPKELLKKGTNDIKKNIEEWIGGPMSKEQQSEFYTLQKNAASMTSLALSVLSSSANTYNNSSSKPAYGEQIGSANKKSNDNLNNKSNKCQMCINSNPKGYYITDYNISNGTYINGRYVQKPGYKICFSCQATGLQNGRGPKACNQCNGERFVKCSYCKGTGIKN